MKTTIRVSCVDQVLKIVDKPLLASGGLNEAVVAFDFCEKWNGFAKTGVFYRDEDEVYYSILDDDDICVIPWEVYSTPGYFYFTVFGDKGDVRRTTNTLKYKAQKGLAGSDMLPSDPTPGVYDQIMGRLSEIEEGEGLANALADYLKENPVQAGATAEEAAQIQQNRENIERLSDSKLDASKLPEAVNEALAQAKASGEFDGKDGEDGKAGNYPDWSNLKWYVMGDSLTERNAITSKHYYDFVQEKTGIQLIVDGIGGTGYGAGASNTQSFQDRVQNIPTDVDVVTIFGSGNDIEFLGGENIPIWGTLSWLANNRPGMRVIVVPPSPWKKYNKREDPWKAYCDNMQLCALACDFRYVSDMYDCPPFSPNFMGHMETFFTTDPAGIHPNENGHKALAPYFYNALLQELAFKA